MIALVSCVVIALIGGLVSQQFSGRFGDGMWTLLATIPGVLIPLGILYAIPAKKPVEWGFPVLAGTLIRAMMVLMIGIPIYLLIGPAKVAFFMTLLAVLLITLVVDVASVMSLIQRHTRPIVVAGGAEGIC